VPGENLSKIRRCVSPLSPII